MVTLQTRVVYYESMNREIKTRPIYECRCPERLKTKTEESTRLVYTGLLGEPEHLKIETRLIDEMFVSVMGEYVFLLFIINRSRDTDKTYSMSVGVMKD